MADQDADSRKQLILLSTTLVVVGLAAVLVIGPVRGDLVEFVERFGVAAPLAFVVIYAILSLALVPGSFMTVAGGVLFGLLLGTLVAVTGGRSARRPRPLARQPRRRHDRPRPHHPWRPVQPPELRRGRDRDKRWDPRSRYGDTRSGPRGEPR